MEPVRNPVRSLKAGGLVLFALLALTVRLLVPTGFMPDTSQGGFRIILCTGDGMVTAWLGADGKLNDGKPTPKKPANEQCAFAALAGSFVAPETSSHELRVVVPEMAEFASPKTVAVGRGLAAPPPPSTGPPAIT